MPLPLLFLAPHAAPRCACVALAGTVLLQLGIAAGGNYGTFQLLMLALTLPVIAAALPWPPAPAAAPWLGCQPQRGPRGA